MYEVTEGNTIPLSLTISGDNSLGFQVEIIVTSDGEARGRGMNACMINSMKFIIK